MADLDDFFAKKDRKKNKNSKKFSTTDEVAKKLEDTAKKSEKPKKERVQDNGENNSQTNDQDEWKEFEEEKKDYSGLKIGNLTASVDHENVAADQDLGSHDFQDGGDTGLDMDKKAGPWKMIDVHQSIEPSLKSEPVVEPKQDIQVTNSSNNSSSQAYKPPALRNQRPGVNTQRRHTRFNSPDISSEVNFPTLCKSTETKKNRNEAAFELVQSNRAAPLRHVEQSQSSSGPTLNLGNRYNTLSNDS